MRPAAPTPCADCPWRTRNQGRRHAKGWFTRRNLRELWARLRTGVGTGQTCHATDPSEPRPEGATAPPAGTEPAECAGALLLVQRELARLSKVPTWEKYAKANPLGLTTAGARWWALARCHFAGTPLGGPPMPVVEETSDVAYDRIDEARSAAAAKRGA